MNRVFLHSDGARYYNKNEYIYDLQNNTLNKQSLNTPSKINTLMENPFLLRDIELFLKKTLFSRFENVTIMIHRIHVTQENN